MFEDSFKYTTMMQGTRMENLCQFLNNEYGKEFRIFARLLSQGEIVPKVIRGSIIPGIEMEIEES